MEIFEMNSLMILGVIVGCGVVLAPIVQIAWILRILIASYIGLCLVLLTPDNLVFNSFAKITYFGCATLVVALTSRGHFFDVSEWVVGRFSFQVFGLAILTILFVVAASSFLVSFSTIDTFMTQTVYDLLTKNIFYFAITPFAFVLLFSKYLR